MVTIKGGTRCYQAPELFKKNARFSRKADVFAAGIIFLELITQKQPNYLYETFYPGILQLKMPSALHLILEGTLSERPDDRKHFVDLAKIFLSEDGAKISDIKFIDFTELDLKDIDTPIQQELFSSYGLGNDESGYHLNLIESSQIDQTQPNGPTRVGNEDAGEPQPTGPTRVGNEDPDLN